MTKPWARKTGRLGQQLQKIGLALGGAAGARLCHHMGMVVCGSTLLNHLKKLSLTEFAVPKILGVDDFAFRKGQRYGTILVDLELNQPIALLADRKAETLADWLIQHPGVEIHARDRSKTYKSGMDLPCVAPDGFLSLGVKDHVDENLRPGYVLWAERVIPLLAVEVVSKAYRKEHSQKLEIYQSIGILYYVVYAPLRKRKARFQVYKLIAGEYVLQPDSKKPYWMPEIGLGIVAEIGNYGNRQREWLYWYDEHGVRSPTPTEKAEAEKSARIVAEQRANTLMERLREMGIDPETILKEKADLS